MTVHTLANDIFSSFKVGGLSFANRIAMSALTRCRAGANGEPSPLTSAYYRQRASAGLILTESIAVAPVGRGGPNVPGLWSDGQTRAWRGVTDAVHEEGGVIFAQLVHCGRIAHSSFGENGEPIVGPSPIAAPGEIETAAGMVPREVPHALRPDELKDVAQIYRRAAENARRAGFDGIELHAAHGCLPETFLRDGTNHRTDSYGGSAINRVRFPVELVEALTRSFDADRISVRISPNTTGCGMIDRDPDATFGTLVEQLNRIGIGWLDLIEGENLVTRDCPGGADTDALLRTFHGRKIVGHGYGLALAEKALAEGRADMVAFGRPFLANPDLVERLRAGAPLAPEAPRELWYGGGAAGYTDFPRLTHPK